MNVRALAESESAQRIEIVRKADTLKEKGVCPTCRNLETGEVYPPTDGRTFYEDDIVACFLETYPRGFGHTTVLVKPHYEDVSELPTKLVAKVYLVIHGAVGALKKVLGAQKVYMCTMCDGKRNHLHYQLIPRMPGEEVRGSRVFVKQPGMLTDHADVAPLE